MFRRRRKAESAADAGSVDASAKRTGDDIFDEPATVTAEDAVRERAPIREPAAPTDGPFDLADVDETEDHATRLDFGALRVPVTDDAEIRVEVAEQTGVIRSISVVHEQGQLQLGAFAAPRSEGIWAEVRATMKAGLTKSGGTVNEQDGPLGTELRAQIPVEDGNRRGTQRVRFVGADGPRWFLRGALTGPAADDDTAAEPLLAVFRNCVVVRGGDPRAPHEALPFSMPEGAEPTAGDAPARPAENPFRRGPEITEIR